MVDKNAVQIYHGVFIEMMPYERKNCGQAKAMLEISERVKEAKKKNNRQQNKHSLNVAKST